MTKLNDYIDNMFVGLPDNDEVQAAKQTITENMTDKYEELLAEGKNEAEALGMTVSEFGSIKELGREMGWDFWEPKTSEKAAPENGSSTENKEPFTASSTAEDVKNAASSAADDVRKAASSVAEEAHRAASSAAEEAHRAASGAAEAAERVAASIVDAAKVTSSSFSEWWKSSDKTAKNKVISALITRGIIILIVISVVGAAFGSRDGALFLFAVLAAVALTFYPKSPLYIDFKATKESSTDKDEQTDSSSDKG